MPPKSKITEQHIVDAAIQIVRNHGIDGLNARTLAVALDCSTQPIFSNFATMEQLLLAVLARADEINSEYIAKEIASGRFPAYKASGMAYIRFAKEEPELFKILYMRDRAGESIPAEHQLTNQMESIVEKNTGLSNDHAKLFHLEMWACVHGIATMFATGFLDLDWELVSNMLTDLYLGLNTQYKKE